MAVEENKALIRQHFAALERGNLEEAASYWAPNAVNHGSGRPGQQPPPGPDGLMGVLRSLQRAFPDRRWQIDELIAEGDMVACRLTVSGTYGDIPPIPVEGAMLVRTPPTGEPYAVQHVHLFRVADGKVTDHRAVRDDLGLLLQLGVLAPPDHALEVTQARNATVERNEDVARRFVETIFNQKRTEALEEFMRPDVILHHSGRTLTPGLDGIKQHQRTLFLGLPDLHYEIEDVVAAGDRVVVRLTISGTHRGEYWGFAATGKRVTMTAIHVLRLMDGKIAETWSESDAVGMREQLAGDTSFPDRVRGRSSPPVSLSS
jgi:predicted ester cyclase